MGETKVNSEKLKFPSEDGTLQLTGILTTPIKQSERKLAIVFVHGLWQHKNVAFLKSFGQRIPADPVFKGVATFRFDCEGLGESEGQTAFTPHHKNLSNLFAAIRFLRAKGYEIVCIYGYSAGGNVALMHAASSKTNIPLYVSSSARFIMDGILDTIEKDDMEKLNSEKHYIFKYRRRGRPVEHKVTSQDIKEFTNIKMDDIVQKIPLTKQLFITHGGSDDRVPTRDGIAISKLLKNSEFLLIKAANHSYQGDAIVEELYEAFKAWYLRNVDYALKQLKTQRQSAL